MVADPENWNIKDIQAPLVWMPSHAHLSDFLDRLTYEHALSGGAMHGGYTGPFRHQEFQRTWLEQHWHRATVGSGVLWEADANDNDHPLYVRPGQALAWSHGCGIAVRDVGALDEIGQALQITWMHCW